MASQSTLARRYWDSYLVFEQVVPRDVPAPQHLRVFLSSPGDVADERNLTRRLLKEELPYDPLLHGNVTLDVVSWDDPAAPAPMLATLTPQEAVNRGLPKPSECDIVVVILWSRLGTPLPPEFLKPNGEPYLSGTEWEFEDACNARPAPDILVYRRQEGPSVKLDDPNLEEKRRQYEMVERFFGRFKNPDGSLRGGVTTYATPTEFKGRLLNDLKALLRRHLQVRDKAAKMPAAASVRETPPPWTGSPYPGLRPFTAGEAAIFFGRDHETDALIARLRNPDQRFLAIVGASGTGKSSLVRAGLLPRLREGAIEGGQHWSILTFTPGATGDNPFLALAVALAGMLPPGGGRTPVALAKALARSPQDLAGHADALLAGQPAGATLVLFVDQIEELFTLVAETHRPAFIALLAWSAVDPRLRVLATLRADFLPQCAAEPELVALLQAGTFPLGPPGQLALAEMIRRPAERARLELEGDLAQEILKDAGNHPGALPLVAFCLEELYRCSAPARRLTVAAYDRLGRLRGAIGRRAHALLEDLREEEGAALESALPAVFRVLVHVEAAGTATRRRAFRHELPETPPVPRIIDALIRGRLLLAGDAGGRATIEVAHEALFEGWPALRSWLKGNRAQLMLRAEIAVDMARWQRANQDEGFLLPKGKRLNEAVALAERHAELLDPAMVTFIQASLARVRHEDEAEWERLRRESLRLTALARHETASGNAATGLLLALEALPRDPDAPDRPVIATAVTTLYDALQGCREAPVLRGHEGAVQAVAFSPDGTCLATAGSDGTARLWDPRRRQEIATLRGHKGTVNAVAFSPDGTRLVTASSDGTARLWDARDGREVAVLRGHEEAVIAAAFSPDGARVVTASWDGTARLWDARDGREVAVLRGHEGVLHAAVFAPDGGRVVTASSDGTARLWEVADGRQGAVLRGHENWVTAAAFAPDEARVVTAALDHTARLWDATGRPGFVLGGHEGGVNAAAFSPDGSRVLTASWDGTARLWDAATGQQRAVLRGHDDVVVTAAFSPDGTRVATASLDRTGRLWDAADGQEIAVLHGHKSALTTVVFSPDGAAVATASKDRTVRLAPVFASLRDLIREASRVAPRPLTREQREKFFLPTP